MSLWGLNERIVLNCGVLQSFTAGESLKLSVIVDHILCAIEIPKDIFVKKLLNYVKKEDSTIREYLGDTEWEQIEFSRLDPPVAVDDLELAEDDDVTVKNLGDALHGRKKIHIVKSKTLARALAGCETNPNFVSVYMQKLAGT